MKLLITGGFGFIGSTLIRHILDTTNFEVINIDSKTSTSMPESLNSYKHLKRYKYENVNICDYNKINSIFYDYQPDSTFHLAAETHVDTSILEPAKFLHTNIIGTYNLLNISKKYLEGNSNKKDIYKFLYISTDEVYGSLELNDTSSTENSSYMPNSPYSASKASADHLVRAWNKTYNLPTLQTNSSNNFGIWQYPEKLIPLVILKCLRGKKIPIYGDGKNIRDWLHVDDHVKGLLLVFSKGKIGETYNISGNNELTNLEIVNKICLIFDKLYPNKSPHNNLISFVTDRPGHDFRYSINNTKISQDLGFKVYNNFNQELKNTVKWYIENESWITKKINSSTE